MESEFGGQSGYNKPAVGTKGHERGVAPWFGSSTLYTRAHGQCLISLCTKPRHAAATSAAPGVQRV